jgi:uncharacterized cupredoxin-like copper-binding protein
MIRVKRRCALLRSRIAALGILAGCAAGVAAILHPAGAFAKGNYEDKKPIPVVVNLGTKDNKLVFEPNRLKFETGKVYKLLLVNVSPVKHELASAELAQAVFTLKAEVVSPDGVEIAEIVGMIHEIEVAPNTTVEWYFVPLRTVTNAPFICDQPGHLAAGMKGLFTIE